jgi:beta-glucosidase
MTHKASRFPAVVYSSAHLSLALLLATVLPAAVLPVVAQSATSPVTAGALLAAVPADAPYRNAALSPQARAADLLGRMTLAEKIGQMTQAERGAIKDPADIVQYGFGSMLSGGGSAPTDNSPAGWAEMIDGFQKQALKTRLGIPLLYGTDAVHGHGNLLNATLFPHNIGLGATRDPDLVAKIGRATAEEMAASGTNWNFSPCLCVARDVRWGRSYESFGERPELAVQMTSIVAGYQGKTVAGYQDKAVGQGASILATAKHFIGDGGTAYQSSTYENYLLDQGDTKLSEAALAKLHLPPFAAAVKAGVGSVMISFSSFNGVKMHAQKHLITDVLKGKDASKGELGFQGLVISDWSGLDQISSDYSVSVRSGINAGIDMVMVPNEYQKFVKTLTEEVEAGRISKERIDDAVTRILVQKFRFGLFEKPMTDRTLAARVGSPEHRALARQAVQQSQVLLKNSGVLPIAPSVKRLLVTGSSADDLGRQMGGWSVTWQGKGGRTRDGTTILAGLKTVAGTGVKIDYQETATAAEAKKYDLAVVVVGETPYAEGKGDIADLSPNESDRAAVTTVCKAVKCVVVVVSGRPLLLTDQLPNISALVAAWLPGTEGAGVADVLFGKAKFTGTLPVTWPRNNNQLPVGAPKDTSAPLFAYGFGLKR